MQKWYRPPLYLLAKFGRDRMSHAGARDTSLFFLSRFARLSTTGRVWPAVIWLKIASAFKGRFGCSFQLFTEETQFSTNCASSIYVARRRHSDREFFEIKFSERCKHCALAVAIKGGAKNFRPAADPLPGGIGWPKFNHLQMVTTFTYRPSLVKIDARIFELSW